MITDLCKNCAVCAGYVSDMRCTWKRWNTSQCSCSL